MWMYVIFICCDMMGIKKQSNAAMRMCWNPVAVRGWRGYFGRVLKVYDEKAQIKQPMNRRKMQL